MWTKEKRTNLRKQLAFNIDPEFLLGNDWGFPQRVSESSKVTMKFQRIFSHYAWINSLPQKLVMKNLQKTGSSPWRPWPHPTGIHPVADLNEISEPPQQNGSFSPSVVRPRKDKMQYIDIYIYCNIYQYPVTGFFLWHFSGIHELFFSFFKSSVTCIWGNPWCSLVRDFNSDQIGSLPQKKDMIFKNNWNL